MRKKRIGRALEHGLTAFLSGLGIYRTVWAEIQGTGQSVLDLWRAGWSVIEIPRYFPIAIANLSLFGLAIAWAWYRSVPKGTERAKR